jgi:hypothetical protein
MTSCGWSLYNLCHLLRVKQRRRKAVDVHTLGLCELEIKLRVRLEPQLPPFSKILPSAL